MPRTKKTIEETDEVISTEETTDTAPETTVEEEAIDTGPHRPQKDELVDGPVIAIDKAAVYVDLTPFGTGIIYGREYINARDLVKKIAIGDSIKAKVVDVENDDGYIELSLKEA